MLLNTVPGSATVLGPDNDQMPEPPESQLKTIDTSRMMLKLDATQAKFTGRFRHPATGQLVPSEGAFRLPLIDDTLTTGSDLQAGQGRGIFRVPRGESAGAVRIEVN